MKLKLTPIAMLFATTHLFAQTTTNCDDVKSENNQLKSAIERLNIYMRQLKSDSSSLALANLQLGNYISSLKNDSTRLQKEDDYLKQALKIFQPIKKANKMKIDFNLIACEGDIQEQTVTITFNLINSDVDKNIQFNIENFGRGQSAIDVQGNAYNTDKITVGADRLGSKLFTDVPIKATIKFTGVPSSALIFKIVELKGFITDSQIHYTNFEVQYKDIPITWK